MGLETINKLYLELSQVATAKTENEIRLQTVVDEAAKKALDLSWQIEKCDASAALTKASLMAFELRQDLLFSREKVLVNKK
jgi:hypothetical protein